MSNKLSTTGIAIYVQCLIEYGVVKTRWGQVLVLLIFNSMWRKIRTCKNAPTEFVSILPIYLVKCLDVFKSVWSCCWFSVIDLMKKTHWFSYKETQNIWISSPERTRDILIIKTLRKHNLQWSESQKAVCHALNFSGMTALKGPVHDRA
jgi:hypothetical protein